MFDESFLNSRNEKPWEYANNKLQFLQYIMISKDFRTISFNLFHKMEGSYGTFTVLDIVLF